MKKVDQKELESLYSASCEYRTSDTHRPACGDGYCRHDDKVCRGITMLRSWVNDESVTGVVLFENLVFDSSEYGKVNCMKVGPNCTYKTPEECEGKHLGYVPSRFQEAVAYWKREETQ